MQDLLLLRAFVGLCADGRIAHGSEADFAAEVMRRLDRLSRELESLEARNVELMELVAAYQVEGAQLTLLPDLPDACLACASERSGG